MISEMLSSLEYKYNLEENTLSSYKKSTIKQSNLTIKLIEYNLNSIIKLKKDLDNLDLNDDAGFKLYKLKNKIQKLDNELICKNKIINHF